MALIPAVIIAISIAVGVVFLVRGSSSRHELNGTLVLNDNDPQWTAAAPCVGHGGYSDISSEARIVVKDAADAIIATGPLGDGNYRAHGLATCEFSFDVKDIPNAEFYTIEVGNRHGLTYSRDELTSKGWLVELSLGQPN